MIVVQSQKVAIGIVLSGIVIGIGLHETAGAKRDSVTTAEPAAVVRGTTVPAVPTIRVPRRLALPSPLPAVNENKAPRGNSTSSAITKPGTVTPPARSTPPSVAPAPAAAKPSAPKKPKGSSLGPAEILEYE